ncbi:MAG: bifunctional folylpolyglutamate synthase/dihydrofolate synthase, partial [Coprococcus phoceensis]
MDYREAITYILEIPKFTKKNSLEHTKDFLRILGNPEKGKKIIHVAGTNGKGSVCAYMQSLLFAEKKTVGFFTSPHLVKMNERIRINGDEISDEMFLSIFNTVFAAVQRMKSEGKPHPTFFEFLFAMAMTAFADSGVEYIILETGIGGRLDATNAI